MKVDFSKFLSNVSQGMLADGSAVKQGCQPILLHFSDFLPIFNFLWVGNAGYNREISRGITDSMVKLAKLYRYQVSFG